MSNRSYTDSQLIKAVKKSKSYRDVYKYLGFQKSNIRVNHRIKQLEIDTSHFSNSSYKGRTKYYDWVSKKIGKLTLVEVIPPVHKSQNYYTCMCDCECGKSVVRRFSYLLRMKDQASCGTCIKRARGYEHTSYKGHKEISSKYWTKLKRQAEQRGLQVEITIKQAWNLFIRQNKRCALSNIELVMSAYKNDATNRTASLDRIDNKKGYIKGNVQWVHKKVNMMKGVLSVNDLVYLCSKVSKHMKGKI